MHIHINGVILSSNGASDLASDEFLHYTMSIYPKFMNQYQADRLSLFLCNLTSFPAVLSVLAG